MAFTRKALSAMEIPAEKIDEIINMHLEVVNPLKDALEKAKGTNSSVEDLQNQIAEKDKEIEALKSQDWQSKYTEEHEKFEAYKNDVENEKLLAAKTEAFKEICKDLGFTDINIELIVKYTDFGEIELDEKGKIVNAKELAKTTKEEWSQLAPTVTEKGADPANPPVGSGGSDTFDKMTLSEKMQYANENPDSPDVRAWLAK